MFCLGENPAQSEADIAHARHLLQGLDHLVVQDIFLTKTAELADVVLPATAAWCESEGTVTNSERRVQRVRKALDAAGRRPRRHGHPAARSPAGSATNDYGGLTLAGAPRRSGTSCARSRPCTAACRTRGSRRSPASSGRAMTRSASSRRTCTAGCGPTIRPSGVRPHRSASCTMIRRWTRSRTSSHSCSRPAAGSTRTTPACSPALSPRRSGKVRRSTCRPTTRPPSA